jgi:O-antigen ligase
LGERNETDLPLTASGKPVDPSAYYRIAFLKEGLRLMSEHPWGTRVGRDAFRKAVREKYGRGGMSHAHNGIVDVGVSLGWVGVILWVAFMGSFALFAARTPDPARSGLRLALVLATAAFFARSLVDATVRDHILQEYMLTAGALVGAIAMAGSRGRA